MTLQDDIVLTVLQSKDIAGCWAENFVNREKYGDVPDRCCYMKLMLLIKWIQSLELYYCNNFTATGNVSDPDFVCLTLAEAQELLAKVKALADL